MTSELPRDKGTSPRELSRLANERAELFALAGAPAGLSKDQHARLAVVERQIDECFREVRQQRAALDARRFTNELPLVRRAVKPRPDADAR
jgi:hypothetical protein